MMDIPADFTDFLFWIKEKTETYWRVKCTGWIQDAQWQGLADEEIDCVEERYGVRFTDEHRSFLRVLHTLDRKEDIEYETEINGQKGIAIEKSSFFYNWLTEEDIIRKSLRWPFETIREDLHNDAKVWLGSWGNRPELAEEMDTIFAKWYAEAPLLLPLKHHTYLVSDTRLKKWPILSVWGSDVIICGWTLKAYLINHFSEALDMYEMVYSEEDGIEYPEFKKEVEPIINEYFQFKLTEPIHYWDEMIMYWNWQFHKPDGTADNC